MWSGCRIRGGGTTAGGGVPGVKALPAAVARIGLLPGDPVFVAPDFKVDLDLLDFVRSKDFRSLERETKQIGLAGSHVPHDRTHSRKAQDTDKACRPIVPAARAAFLWQRYRHCPQRRYPGERLVQPLRIRISRHPVVLAAIARHTVTGAAEGARQGYRTARTELGEVVPPHAVDAGRLPR